METLDHKISTLNNSAMEPLNEREYELVRYWHDNAQRVLVLENEKLVTQLIEAHKVIDETVEEMKWGCRCLNAKI